MFEIKSINDPMEKQRVSRLVLESLKDWFEIDETRENYIAGSAGQPCFAAYDGGKPIGFLCLKPTSGATIELAVMGVMQPYHRCGAGRKLFEAARAWAKERGYAFMQVKTVQMGFYEDYDRTNLFYKSLGFLEFEVFPTLWDADNPCQVYVMAL